MADRQEDKHPKTEPVEDLPPTEEKSADVKGGWGLQVGTLAHGSGGGAGKG
jgi:hypothetical protein